MNPDTTPTPRTDAVMASSNWPYHITSEMQKLERELAEKTNEANNWHQHYRDEASKAQRWKQAYIEQEKEVEKLRNLLERLLDYTKRNLPYWGSKYEEEYNQLNK